MFLFIISKRRGREPSSTAGISYLILQSKGVVRYSVQRVSSQFYFSSIKTHKTTPLSVNIYNLTRSCNFYMRSMFTFFTKTNSSDKSLANIGKFIY